MTINKTEWVGGVREVINTFLTGDAVQRLDHRARCSLWGLAQFKILNAARWSKAET